MNYALLKAPHANARYDASLETLLACEFEVALPNLGSLEPFSLNGLKLHRFSAPEELSERELFALARLSGALAAFSIESAKGEIEENGSETLRPIALPQVISCARDMPSILKYKGKTNESFTRLLINIAAYSSKLDPMDKLSLLDPMAGKGTTLFCALGYGYNSLGLEKSKKDVEECLAFTKKYLQYEKMKHSYKRHSLTLSNNKGSLSLHEIETAADIQKFKAGDSLTLAAACADARDIGRLKAHFDIAVCDLPYGIQHESTRGRRGADLLTLLKEVLPGLKASLNKGGAVALAFNSYTLKRDDIRAVCAQSGLEPLVGGAYDRFEHWVEQAVNRDIVVALRP